MLIVINPVAWILKGIKGLLMVEMPSVPKYSKAIMVQADMTSSLWSL